VNTNTELARELISMFETSSLTSLTYDDGQLKMSLTKSGMSSAAVPRPNISAATAVPAADVPDPGYIRVKSPIVGTVYKARKAGEPPLVNVGGSVSEGDALCVIEAMKMFSDVPAPCSGTIRELTFGDGDFVEFGTVLALIEKTS